MSYGYHVHCLSLNMYLFLYLSISMYIYLYRSAKSSIYTVSIYLLITNYIWLSTNITSLISLMSAYLFSIISYPSMWITHHQTDTESNPWHMARTGPTAFQTANLFEPRWRTATCRWLQHCLVQAAAVPPATLLGDLIKRAAQLLPTLEAGLGTWAMIQRQVGHGKQVTLNKGLMELNVCAEEQYVSFCIFDNDIRHLRVVEQVLVVEAKSLERISHY